MEKEIKKRTCNNCGTQMFYQLFIANTNIAFPVLTDRKNYDNDDGLMGVCVNKKCILCGVVQITKELLPT